ncbi:MAG: hypothetical protein JNK40_10180 [Chromatiales bacterium]|nr:hypothetical protein [Chromatiales bacterium]
MRRLFFLASLLHLPPAFPDDGLGNAYFLCDIFEKTGVSTDCKASNATSTVDVIIATDAAGAADVCTVIANNMVQKKRSFGGRWQLRIFAPDRADEPLAACRLK